ncbi:hypothetical protein BaRGS_00023209, partial [Batillaria attramentaria]
SSTPIPAVQTSLMNTPYTEDGANYSSVKCSFIKPFPTVTGTLEYSVFISPGSVTPHVSFAGSNTIESPVSPSVTCSPSPYVPENQNVTCTCSTQSLGNPEGRLMWFRGNNFINTGNYGDTSLVMTPQTLTLSDHGNTIFRCGVDWIQAIQGKQYTASVGYGPPRPTLTVSAVEVTENQTVTFSCQADAGRPAPSVTLAKNGTELTNQSSPLSHSVSRARCEDAGVYTCIASNGMGPDTTDDVTLLVNVQKTTEENSKNIRYFEVVAGKPGAGVRSKSSWTPDLRAQARGVAAHTAQAVSNKPARAMENTRMSTTVHKESL